MAGSEGLLDGKVVVISGVGPALGTTLARRCAEAGADLMNAASWQKSPGPVFVSSAEQGIYGPGHNSFLTEPDGTVLNVFHARNYRDIAGDPLKDTGRATRVAHGPWMIAGAVAAILAHHLR